jgi:GTP-binding protein
VLTKTDALRAPELEARAVAMSATIRKRPAAFPLVLATSARSGVGIPELRGRIARLLKERTGG